MPCTRPRGRRACHVPLHALRASLNGRTATAHVPLILQLATPNPGAAAIFTQLWFIGGEFLLVLVSVLFARWRSQAAACALLLSALLLLWPLLPESGRWLLAHGRKEEAMLVGGQFMTCRAAAPTAHMLPPWPCS